MSLLREGQQDTNFLFWDNLFIRNAFEPDTIHVDAALIERASVFTKCDTPMVTIDRVTLTCIQYALVGGEK